MKTILVNKTNCHNCPFYVVEFDSYGLGDCFTYSCNLENKIITTNDTGDDSSIKKPEWCPIDKNDGILINPKK